jgi:hypothetical protein
MKKLHICAIAFLLVIGFLSLAEAKECLIFHKPAFHGRLIDNETKEPIDGAVVVSVYKVDLWFCISPGGCNGYVINVREALTDKKGEFTIASYTTLIQPFAFADETDFIIYKAGYASYPKGVQKSEIKPLEDCRPEYLFSGEMGAQGSVTYPSWHQRAKNNTATTISCILGIAELPRVKTKEERLNAFPLLPTDYGEKELPLLFKALNKENDTIWAKKNRG